MSDCIVPRFPHSVYCFYYTVLEIHVHKDISIHDTFGADSSLSPPLLCYDLMPTTIVLLINRHPHYHQH